VIVSGLGIKPGSHLQMGLLNLAPCFCAVQKAPGPQGEGLHGSGSSTHLWFKHTSPLRQSGSRTHSGAHPVMVSGLGIMPGTQLQMALPSLLTVQMVLGPQGEGWQGFEGGRGALFTKMLTGDRGTTGIRGDLTGGGTTGTAQRLTQPSKQQSPWFGQSVSLTPGLQH